MPDKTFKTRIKNKIDTTTNWAESDLILKDGELGLERTTSGAIKIKVGDGENTWSQLNYITDEIQLDNTPTENSNNLLSSGSIYTALKNKGVKIKEKVFDYTFKDTDYNYFEGDPIEYIIPPGESTIISNDLYNQILTYMQNNKTTYLNDYPEELEYLTTSYIDESLNNVTVNAWLYNIEVELGEGGGPESVEISDNTKNGHMFSIMKMTNEGEGLDVNLFLIEGSTPLLNWNFYQPNEINQLEFDPQPTKNSKKLMTSEDIYNNIVSTKPILNITVPQLNDYIIDNTFIQSENGESAYAYLYTISSQERYIGLKNAFLNHTNLILNNTYPLTQLDNIVDKNQVDIIYEIWGYNLDSSTHLPMDSTKPSFAIIFDEHLQSNFNIWLEILGETSDLLPKWTIINQKLLTNVQFDNIPTENSRNLIDSGDLYNAIQYPIKVYQCTNSSNTISLPSGVTLQEIYELMELGIVVYLDIPVDSSNTVRGEIVGREYNSSTDKYLLSLMFPMAISGQVIHILIEFVDNATSAQMQLK